MSHVAWFVPGVMGSLVVSLIVASAVARALRVGWFGAWLLVLSLGVVLSATVTPIQGALEGGGLASRSCDFSRTGFIPPAELLTANDSSLNVVLFVPLGWALGLIPNTRRKLVLILGVLALPFGIEALQLTAPMLNRGCESGDVIDNLTGAVVGFAGATVFRWLRSPWQSGGDPAARR